MYAYDVCAYVSVHVCAHVYMYICVCVHVYMCVYVYVYTCVVVYACMCICVYMCAYTYVGVHMLLCVHRSEDNLRYQSSPSALFETSSTHYCVCWAGWSASLTSRGLHLPQPHRCMGITDVGCCICLYMISGIQTQLTAAQHVLPT